MNTSISRRRRSGMIQIGHLSFSLWCRKRFWTYRRASNQCGGHKVCARRVRDQQTIVCFQQFRTHPVEAVFILLEVPTSKTRSQTPTYRHTNRSNPHTQIAPCSSLIYVNLAILSSCNYSYLVHELGGIVFCRLAETEAHSNYFDQPIRMDLMVSSWNGSGRSRNFHEFRETMSKRESSAHRPWRWRRF